MRDAPLLVMTDPNKNKLNQNQNQNIKPDATKEQGGRQPMKSPNERVTEDDDFDLEDKQGTKTPSTRR